MTTYENAAPPDDWQPQPHRCGRCDYCAPPELALPVGCVLGEN